MALEKEKTSFKEQFSALKNLPRFLKMVWATSQGLAFSNIILRVFKAAIPLATLYVGKIIIDEIIAAIGQEDYSL
ncbi:MAG: ABC transporter ATP-binding protein, partial [Saprospiraceae bacterium]|nr:ABC transporter ATP-binding protein [Saprospiraceae bacterium]